MSFGLSLILLDSILVILFMIFYKVALFTTNISKPFAVGQVHGYCGGEPDLHFWKLYSLYAAMIFPADIVWTNRSTPYLLDDMKERLNGILEDHNDFFILYSKNGINQANLINKGVIYMDKIAVISDIHGNIQALESVLNDIKLRGIERIICLGDLVGKGPHSSEAIEIIRKECEVVVMGNWDDFITKPTEFEALKWHQKTIIGRTK